MRLYIIEYCLCCIVRLQLRMHTSVLFRLGGRQLDVVNTKFCSGTNKACSDTAVWLSIRIPCTLFLHFSLSVAHFVNSLSMCRSLVHPSVYPLLADCHTCVVQRDTTCVVGPYAGCVQVMTSVLLLQLGPGQMSECLLSLLRALPYLLSHLPFYY